MKNTLHTNLTKNYWVISLILGVLGTCIILFATIKNGIGVTPDTTLYFSVANNMANLVRYGGDAGTLIIAEPPLFPAILAILKLVTGAEPFVIARYHNAIIFGVVVFLSGLLFKGFFASTPIFFLVGTVSVLISYSLVSVYLMAMTESLFILFVLMFILFLNSHLTKPTKQSLLLLSLSAMSAFLTRYVGAVLIFVGVICIVLFLAENWKDRIRKSIIFSLIAGLPTSLWVVKDLMAFTINVSGKTPAKYSPFQNLGNALDNILSWFVPYRVIHSRIFVIGFCLVVALMVFFLLSNYLRRDREKNHKVLRLYGPFVVLIVSYFSFLLLLNRFVVDLENRYLAPMFIPISLLILAFVKAFADLLKDKFNSRIGTLFTIFFCVAWIIIPINKTIHIIEEHYREGWGYSSITWQKSKTIQYVVENYQNCTFYSNRKDAIKYLTGLDSKLIPVKLSGEENQKSLEEVWPPETNTCLVIFKSVNRYYLYTEEELLSVSDIQETIHFDDGTIYILRGR